MREKNGIAGQGFQAFGDGGQHQVAETVAECVVYKVEPVDIKREKRQKALASR